MRVLLFIFSAFLLNIALADNVTPMTKSYSDLYCGSVEFIECSGIAKAACLAAVDDAGISCNVEIDKLFSVMKESSDGSSPDVKAASEAFGRCFHKALNAGIGIPSKRFEQCTLDAMERFRLNVVNRKSN